MTDKTEQALTPDQALSLHRSLTLPPRRLISHDDLKRLADKKVPLKPETVDAIKKAMVPDQVQAYRIRYRWKWELDEEKRRTALAVTYNGVTVTTKLNPPLVDEKKHMKGGGRVDYQVTVSFKEQGLGLLELNVGGEPEGERELPFMQAFTMPQLKPIPPPSETQRT